MGDPLLLGTLLSYLVSLAASLRADAIGEARHKKNSAELARATARLQAIQDRRSLEDQLRLVGTNVARSMDRLGVAKRERHIFQLLTDEVFQSQLADWLVAWDPAQKRAAEATLVESLVDLEQLADDPATAGTRRVNP